MVGTPVRAALTALLVAAGGAGDVPPDIAEWFEREAPAVLLEMSQGTVVIDDDLAPPEFEQVEVGTPRPQYTWSGAFRDGEVTDSPLEPLGQWGAPYRGDGRLTGTVVAWHDDGVAALAYADDHVELAEAVAELPEDATWVEEAMLFAHFAVIGDEVHTLVPGRYGATETVLPLAEFQDSLVHWHAVAGPWDETPVDGGGVASGLAVALGVGAAALFAAAGAVAFRVRRRSTGEAR